MATNWGLETDAGTNWNFNATFAYFSAVFPAGSNQLDSVSLLTPGTDTFRIGVYSGGTLDDPEGATLLEDLGTVVGGSGSWATLNSTANPSLPAETRVWVAVKNDAFSGPRRSTSTVGGDDFDSHVYRTSGNNTNGAWDATVPSATWALDAQAASVYLTYSAVASGPTITNVPNMTRGIQATITGTGFGT